MRRFEFKLHIKFASVIEDFLEEELGVDYEVEDYDIVHNRYEVVVNDFEYNALVEFIEELTTE